MNRRELRRAGAGEPGAPGSHPTPRSSSEILTSSEHYRANAPRNRNSPKNGEQHSAHNGAIVRLIGVSQHYGRGEASVSALSGVDLDVHPGELVAVMGPSGSGKSTLLAIAGGLAMPTSGEVVVEGTYLSTLGQAGIAALRRRALGYVFQDFNLIPTLTALENVILPLELDGISGRAAKRAGRDALSSVDLDDKLDVYPDDLSGGQQQRVAIARAIVGARRLILADEPTGALDSETGELVMRVLRQRVDAGAAGILVTHEPRHASWADRIVFLRDGRVVDESVRERPEDLLAGVGAL